MIAWLIGLTWLLALVPLQGITHRVLPVAVAVVRYFPLEEQQTMMCMAWQESGRQPWSTRWGCP